MSVKECVYYHDGECGCDFEDWNGEIVSYSKCEDIKDCYFKMLGQMEQENKKLSVMLNEIEKLTTIREVHGLTDAQYVENFRLHQERILDIIDKAKEQ